MSNHSFVIYNIFCIFFISPRLYKRLPMAMFRSSFYVHVATTRQASGKRVM